VSEGAITRVNGPVVEIAGLDGLGMRELVEVGPQRLPGEVIALDEDRATAQVYEYTGGLRPGDAVAGTGGPLAIELGPGLLGGVFDGMLRDIGRAGGRIGPGTIHAGLRSDPRWDFVPALERGARVAPGAIVGTVRETGAIEHRILVPAAVAGTVEWVAERGRAGTRDPVARIGGREVRLSHRWPVRTPRPHGGRLEARRPLHTGQRVLDLMFPVVHGSTTAVPGGFGTGKTLMLQQIAKWCDADVIVYVGCGERGNELADVLEDFTGLEDPRTGGSLRERTILIANTSNMPVMAREASVYTGITVAEHYRDMGHDCVVIADSTSRWAEALRELASRTGELPAEEGYPAGLSSALAAFYERAGEVRTSGGEIGSVSVLGAVSPPGGDLAEPVTAHTRRFVRAVWSLDRDLAYARHYPAVSWEDSSSRDVAAVASWHAERGESDWDARRREAMALLLEADRLESVAELVGVESLPASERVTLLAARLLREGVLAQSAIVPNDQHSAPAKQAALLALVLSVRDHLLEVLDRGVPIAAIESLDLTDVTQARTETPPDGKGVARIAGAVLGRLAALGGEAAPA